MSMDFEAVGKRLYTCCDADHSVTGNSQMRASLLRSIMSQAKAVEGVFGESIAPQHVRPSPQRPLSNH